MILSSICRAGPPDAPTEDGLSSWVAQPPCGRCREEDKSCGGNQKTSVPPKTQGCFVNNAQNLFSPDRRRETLGIRCEIRYNFSAHAKAHPTIPNEYGNAINGLVTVCQRALVGPGIVGLPNAGISQGTVVAALSSAEWNCRESCAFGSWRAHVFHSTPGSWDRRMR